MLVACRWSVIVFAYRLSLVLAVLTSEMWFVVFVGFISNLRSAWQSAQRVHLHEAHGQEAHGQVSFQSLFGFVGCAEGS